MCIRDRYRASGAVSMHIILGSVWSQSRPVLKADNAAIKSFLENTSLLITISYGYILPYARPENK